MGAVKEQSANLYATKMAEQGFVAVSIDLPSYGGSEGQPRNNVLPDLYSEGVSAAVDYLGLQPYVDRRRIGAIGVCGSGSFVLSAAKVDPRISAIATSSMYDMGAVNRNAWSIPKASTDAKKSSHKQQNNAGSKPPGAESSIRSALLLRSRMPPPLLTESSTITIAPRAAFSHPRARLRT